jgi:ferredoxin
MRVRIDRSMCQGHARCWSTLPGVFVLDDDGYAAITEARIDPADEPVARRAVTACPERAISIVEESAP